MQPVAWDLSCRDWETKIREGHTPIADLPLFKDEADEALGFFNDLRLPDVIGTPRLEDAAGDWFKDAVRAAFGSYDKKNRIRYIREIFLMAPKGSSKTSYSAGLGLTALLMNMRKRAELLIVAETQGISELAFNAMAGMIEEDEELKRRFDPKAYSNKFEVYDRVLGAELKIKSFDKNVLTGVKPIWVLLDELHLLGKMSGAAKVLTQIRGGLQKNPEGMLVIITTQSDEPPKGVFEAELEAARAIRDGKRQGRMLPILYEFPKDIAKDQSKWGRPDNWHMVSPNLGRSIHLHDLVSGYEDAKTKGVAEVKVWASQHLNIQIGVGLRSDGWAGAEHWMRAEMPEITLEEIIKRSDVIAGGVDGGGLDDLLGLSFIGRERGTKRWLHWAHAFITPEGMERRKANAVDYEQFIADGDLTLVEKMPDDLNEMTRYVEQVKDSGLLVRMGVDGAGLGGIVDALAEIGITQEAELLEAIRQGMGLMGAFKTVERKVLDGSFKHSGSRLMTWCVGNAMVTATPTGARISREASGFGKIDPLIATFNAADIMATNPQPKDDGQMDEFLKMPLVA